MIPIAACDKCGNPRQAYKEGGLLPCARCERYPRWITQERPTSHGLTWFMPAEPASIEPVEHVWRKETFLPTPWRHPFGPVWRLWVREDWPIPIRGVVVGGLGRGDG